MRRSFFLIIPLTPFLGLILLAVNARSQQVDTSNTRQGTLQTFSLSNDMVTQRVILQGERLEGDELEGRSAWLAKYNRRHHGVWTDGDFGLELMWTDWSAPGKIFNGDLQLILRKKDFRYLHHDFRVLPGGGRELELYFTPLNPDNTIQVRLTYELLPGKFYAKREIGLIDTMARQNWLEALDPRQGRIAGLDGSHQGDRTMMREESSDQFRQIVQPVLDQTEETRIIKRGAFGQPCAADFARGGVFFGIEYPAANNLLARDREDHLILSCRELMGEIVGSHWVESHWVVEGLAPNHYVRDWFFNYIPDIRVVPNKPYTLYNSWYDLRSPRFAGLQASHVMNQQNILHIIGLFKKDMIEPYGIHLDAFVLDDGWDSYSSDWKMRTETFPHGVAPMVHALKPLGTSLGLWFGPTGGYSFRMRRIDWMKAHGYETVGEGPDHEMMDIAGPKYSALFRKRVTDFVKQGVGYFKWDGLQFSSSNPDNGHPVGYHSRKAALESLIGACRAVRAINPHIFLNITSGTWLSPWWMKYANQIWMQGADYGYADNPVINQRDGAVTYKDDVLYDDFHNQDDWFPISNLMTHGIIKGNLANLGGTDDPLDKFTDDMVFYFGRGVSMYEMYISPDLLKPGEWKALSMSLAWARSRFSLMAKSYMIGGDPTRGQAYGYVHFKADSGILALRNPRMQSQTISVKLDPALGLADSANSLVLEQIYPSHWIAPDLFGAGTTIHIPLQGYESAIYELYPLDQASKPLLAGVDYEVLKKDGSTESLHLLRTGRRARILNPGFIKEIQVDGKIMPADHLELPPSTDLALSQDPQISFPGDGVQVRLSWGPSVIRARYIVCLEPDSGFVGKPIPAGLLTLDGKLVTPNIQQQKGVWSCYSLVLTHPGRHILALKLKATGDTGHWSGTVQVWLNGQQQQKGQRVVLSTQGKIRVVPMLPDPFPKGILKLDQALGEGRIKF